MLALSIQKSAFVPIAVAAGFTFLFDAASYLMLLLRLTEAAPDVPFASRFVGAGGVVPDKDNNLVVKNRYRSGTLSPADLSRAGSIFRMPLFGKFWKKQASTPR